MIFRSARRAPSPLPQDAQRHELRRHCKSSPTSPLQVCLYRRWRGNQSGADVKNGCTCTSGYTIRGTVSGLTRLRAWYFKLSTRAVAVTPGMPLAPPVPITSNGPFTFIVEIPRALLAMGWLSIISQQPASPDQICLVSQRNQLPAGNVTDSEVGCSQFALCRQCWGQHGLRLHRRRYHWCAHCASRFPGWRGHIPTTRSSVLRIENMYSWVTKGATTSRPSLSTSQVAR